MYNQGNEFSYESVFDYAYRHGINIFTTNTNRSDKLFFERIHDTRGRIYMHTFNDIESVEKLLVGKGVYGVYTDFLSAKALSDYTYPIR